MIKEKLKKTDTKNKEKAKVDTDKEIETEDKLSNDVVVRILAALVFVILLFFIGIRFFEYRNRELISDFYENTGLFISVENTTEKLIIDINKAEMSEFTQLPGIGTVKAQAIHDYREQNGYFTSIDELKNIKGIGDDIFEILEEYVTVSIPDEATQKNE